MITVIEAKNFLLFYLSLSSQKPFELLYSLTVAGITNCHKLGGLKPHKCLLLQFWRSELRHEVHRTEDKMSACLVPAGASKGRTHVLFSAPGGQLPWLMVPSFIFKSHHSKLLHHCLTFSSASDSSCIPLIRTFVIILGSPNNPG